MIRFAHVSLGEGAGPSCVTCASAQSAARPRSGDDVIAEIQEIANEWTAGTGPNVLLEGFEPFSHPQLPALVAAAIEAGFARVGLETDGGALAQAGNAAGALHAGVRHLRLRTLGLDDLGDELAGRAGLAVMAAAGVSVFREVAASTDTRVAISAVIPVCEHNLASLPATVAALADMGAGAARLIRAGELPANAAAGIAAACDTGTVNRVWVDVHDLPLPETHRAHLAGDVA